MNNRNSYDYVIVGGGVIGLSVAKLLAERFPGSRIALLEKEQQLAAHASGRNSGVLHAGFYYTADSLKARFTRQGNIQWKAFCREHGLAMNECGKLVVASDAAEYEQLHELKRRGDRNGVPLDFISASEAARIDPNVRTHEAALWSPSTATVDPKASCAALAEHAQNLGVTFLRGATFQRRLSERTVLTAAGTIEADYLINCAGLYADRVAKAYGFGGSYVIMPFKGLYLKYTGQRPPVRTNVYPVPDLRNPFLGVHFTVTVDGAVKIGPTATPAFWRENYSMFERFSVGELTSVALRQLDLLARNSFNFRSLAISELRKHQRSHFVKLAAKLVHEIDADGFNLWIPPGIRAQLMEKKTRKLVQDFVLEGDARSLHVLNAVSPAFTCAFPMAEHVLNEMTRLRGMTTAKPEAAVVPV